MSINFKNIPGNVIGFFKSRFFRSRYKKTTTFIKRKPLSSFFIALILLFAAIFIGNFLTTPKPQPQAENIEKTVSIFSVGESPKSTFQAKIEKSGVIKIVALAPGVIQEIFVNEGDSVTQGQQLFTLSSNYTGGNAPGIQAQIADAQYKNVTDTFQAQKDLIQKQRDIANINHDNFSEMQSIATASANDTNDLINANQTILDTLNLQLQNDKNNSAPQATILSEESQINQLQGAQNQLKTGLRNLQEETDDGKAPGRLSDAQRDITQKQLDIQEKSLELNKEVSRLSADMADINAASMFPSSPFAATIERVYVRVGQVVTPGMPLAEISASDPRTSAIVDLPENIARNISTLDASNMYINNESNLVRPAFVPTEPTSGSLFSVIYPIPDALVTQVSDGEYIRIDIPVGNINTSGAVPFIPLDAIYQTQDSSYLIIAKNGKAVVQKVTVGNIFGSFAEITGGLHSGDQVILDRNVIAGDKISIK